MLSKANVMKVFFSFLALTLFAFSRLSYADWSVGINVGGPGYYHERPGGYYRWHDHPHYGWHIHYLPAGYFTIRVGGVRYFYYDGLYYTYIGEGDYVLVNPPIGAYVRTIPPDFQPVTINGTIYYINSGIYYILTPRGYEVVAAPKVYAQPQVVVTQPVTTVVAAPVAVETQDTFPVNVPNKSGGYTVVVIKKSGNGYVGPQGEFYATFPKVAQLKAMYVK
jgi:hypothetical protein